jgi:hypothetical protein
MLQLRLLPNPGVVPQLEQLAFAIDNGGDIRISGPGKQLIGKLDRFIAVTLAFEPCLARGKFVETFGDNGKIGARAVSSSPQDIASLDGSPSRTATRRRFGECWTFLRLNRRRLSRER